MYTLKIHSAVIPCRVHPFACKTEAFATRMFAWRRMPNHQTKATFLNASSLWRSYDPFSTRCVACAWWLRTNESQDHLKDGMCVRGCCVSGHFRARVSRLALPHSHTPTFICSCSGSPAEEKLSTGGTRAGHGPVNRYRERDSSSS